MRNCKGMMKFAFYFSTCILFIVSGCATPRHSNTLIFATNTKFALDVSADPSGSPSITAGYKRQEAVWMPLLANKDEKGSPASCMNETCLFRGKAGTDMDTYSVLASFGAKFSGKGDASGAKAEGGLAQYFATGLAARKLAEVGGARLVAVQPADSELLQDYREKGKRTAQSRMCRKLDILRYVAPGDILDQQKWDALIDSTDLEDTDKSSLKALKDLNAVNQRLDMDAAMNGTVIDALHKKLK